MKFNNKIITFMSVVFLFTAHTVKAEDSKDPIKMTLHDWTGQLITTNIMAEVLKKAGNNVETKVFDGQIHGFLTMGARIKDTAKLISLVSNRIDNAFK